MDMVSLTKGLIVEALNMGQPVVHAPGACQLVGSATPVRKASACF